MILINASAHSAAPALYPELSYDVTRDFSAVIPFGSAANVVIIAGAAARERRLQCHARSVQRRR
jgi:hypothetical protein